MALELNDIGKEVRIVTSDYRDKGKLSMVTAANRLGLPTCRLFVFLREEGLEH